MSTFVLVHGAWHGARRWERVSSTDREGRAPCSRSRLAGPWRRPYAPERDYAAKLRRADLRGREGPGRTGDPGGAQYGRHGDQPGCRVLSRADKGTGLLVRIPSIEWGHTGVLGAADDGISGGREYGYFLGREFGDCR
jgi:hypothetical protein